MAVQKFPPPPSMTGEFQQLNRWLIEIQNILNSGGTISPGQVEGLLALIAQVAVNTANIATNTANIATNTANIATLFGAVAAINATILIINGRLTALENRNQILNGGGPPGGATGSDGDLYLNNAGAPGTRLYGKIGGVWVVIA